MSTKAVQGATLFPIMELFPDKEFKAGGKKTALHFYIAHSNNQFIPDWIRKNPELLNIQDPKYGLSPLAVCAMKGDLATAKLLMDAKADCTLADTRGWTPLHFATLRGDAEMKALFLAADKAHSLGLDKIKNVNGATPKDLERITNFGPFPQDEIVFRYRNEKGDIVDGTRKQFKEMTGAEFTDFCIATPQFLAGEWMENPQVKVEKEIIKMSEFIKPKYETFRNTPTKIFLSKEENGCGWNAVAEQEFEAFQVVTRYAGKQQNKLGNESGEYFLHPTNGITHRNFGPMLNDGMPNCVHVPIYREDGVFLQHVLVAIRPIQKGEKLLWDYGMDTPVKFICRQEIDADKLEAYFKSNPPQSLLKRIRENTEKGLTLPEELVRVEFDAVPMRYLFRTPSALLNLYFKGTITTDSILPFLRNSFFINLVGFSQTNLQTILMPLIKLMVGLDVLKQKNSQLHGEVLALIDSFKKEDMRLQIFKFYYLAESIKGITKAEDIKQLKGKCDKIREIYDKGTEMLTKKELAPNAAKKIRDLINAVPREGSPESMLSLYFLYLVDTNHPEKSEEFRKRIN